MVAAQRWRGTGQKRPPDEVSLPRPHWSDVVRRRTGGWILEAAAAFRGPIYDPVLRKTARAVLPILFRGRGVVCPCCDRTFRSFIRRYRWDALCPGCLSLSRHRLLWLYLRHETDLLDRPQSLLHFAPEEAIEKHLEAAPLRYVRADLHPRSPDVTKADITSLPFHEGEFDVVLCSHVLEHVADDRKAMAELHRVLKPDGRLYMLQPVRLENAATLEDPFVTARWQRRRLFGQRDHVRIYGRDLISRLESAGFAVTPERYSRRLPWEHVRLYGLHDEPIFVCRKSALTM